MPAWLHYSYASRQIKNRAIVAFTHRLCTLVTALHCGMLHSIELLWF